MDKIEKQQLIKILRADVEGYKTVIKNLDNIIGILKHSCANKDLLIQNLEAGISKIGD